MISWMQKHNKYLVWTIWVATIAFIGAGFVGWGSYNFGSKSGTVAKVGEIEIKQVKLNMVYSNIYNQYNEMLQGTLDDKTARELGLIKQAFATLEIQAKILNLAKDFGIVVSNEEISTKLQGIEAFQKDKIFNQEIYKGYLRSQRLKAKDFEATIQDDITIKKILTLLETESLPLEIEAIGAAMNIADKIAYTVLSESNLSYISDEIKVKDFWETRKESYMTNTLYDLSLLWTPSNDANITDEELKDHYEANSFKYTNTQGKQLSFNDAKNITVKDLKLKKTKKSAQKAYIAFKKGSLQSSEKVILPMNDPKLSKIVWSEIKQKSSNDILKPKVVAEQYVTVKINSIKKPQIMTFEEAKEKVTTAYDKQAKKEALLILAEDTLSNFDESNANMSKFLSLNKQDKLKALNSEESLQFLEKLFTSNKEKGIITLSDKVIVYTIVEQKVLSIDTNQEKLIKKTVNQLKKKIFESNLLKILNSKYPTEVYMGGLTN